MACDNGTIAAQAALMGPNEDLNQLRGQTDFEKELPDVIQGNLSVAEYIHQEEIKVQTLMREEEELKAAWLEMDQAMA